MRISWHTPPRSLTAFLFLCVLSAAPLVAQAGEADDLQAMIERARQGTRDLEGLDQRGAARDEITVLRVWLDEAWRFRAEQKYDEVRQVLNRADAQAEMIRHRITAERLATQAAEKEAQLARVRDEIAKTKQAIQAATLQKAQLEAKAGK
jgi:hypothetical protein